MNSPAFLCNIFEKACCNFLQNGLQYGNKQKQPVLKELHFLSMFKNKVTRLALIALAALTLTVPAISALPQEAAVTTVAQAAAAVYGTTDQPITAYPVRVNGLAMTQDPMLTDVNGQTYVSLRAVAQALDEHMEISWDGSQAVAVHWGLVDVTAKPGQKYVVANQRYLYVPHGVQSRSGAVLVPLDILCKALDATWTQAADGSYDLTTDSGAILPGGQFYDQNDLYWLSRIIYSESGNQPLNGKIAVGNVVLNRVNSPRFPNTIHGVIFQKNQFSPAANGTINRTPNAESVLAAKLCLDGGVALDDVLWFNRTGLKSWASRNRSFVATIAGHSFYA